MTKKTGTKNNITDLIRNILGSISLSDIKDIDKMSFSFRRNYIKEAENVWMNPVFQNEIKIIIQKQLEFIGMEAKDILEVSVGRGTINGVDLLKERFETLHNEYIEAKKPPEKFDEFEPV